MQFICLENHRSPASAETEYFLGKAYVQNGQGRTGAEILRRVYYNYATSYTADNAAADLKKIPEAAFTSGPVLTATMSTAPMRSTRHVGRPLQRKNTRRWLLSSQQVPPR